MRNDGIKWSTPLERTALRIDLPQYIPDDETRKKVISLLLLPHLDLEKINRFARGPRFRLLDPDSHFASNHAVSNVLSFLAFVSHTSAWIGIRMSLLTMDGRYRFGSGRFKNVVYATQVLVFSHEGQHSSAAMGEPTAGPNKSQLRARDGESNPHGRVQNPICWAIRDESAQCLSAATPQHSRFARRELALVV